MTCAQCGDEIPEGQAHSQLMAMSFGGGGYHASAPVAAFCSEGCEAAYFEELMLP